MSITEKCAVEDCGILQENRKTVYCMKHNAKFKKYGDANYSKYGSTTIKNHKGAYGTYKAMKLRCLNENSSGYAYYGGRGVSICDRWLNGFRYFLEDMGDRPDGATIDRIDPDGDYTPENCRWVTWDIQSMNKRRRNIKQYTSRNCLYKCGNSAVHKYKNGTYSIKYIAKGIVVETEYTKDYEFALYRCKELNLEYANT